MKKYALLDIWDRGWMKRNGIKNPRNVFQKTMLNYLFKTTPYAKRIWARGIDKILKYFI